ncbi:MAG: HEAT repeat domain-containing protein [Proteobacteria bacterium]|nr:HEAT repeat domain-containing protein [Pseudomonadota bacterium]
MQRIRAFFLTIGLGLLAGAVLLLVARPEPPDMGYREFISGFMVASFCAGFIFVLIFSNKLRVLNLIGAAVFGLSILAMYLGGRFGGHSVGSPGWGIGMILILFVFPAALVVFSLPGVVSLVAAVSDKQASRRGFYAGIGLLAATAAVLAWMVFSGPDLDRLLSEIHDPNAETRMEAIGQLGRADHNRATDALTSLLNDKLPLIRAEAARALGTSPSHFMAVEPLTRALRDEEFQVRRNAAFSLGQLIGAQRNRRYSRTVAELIDRLKDESPPVREAAAYALGRIGDRKAIEPLIEALADEEARFQAHNALLMITGRHLGDDPAEWRAWLKKK